ncbi:hypothetical protein D3C87_1586260 [compost metagenome]
MAFTINPEVAAIGINDRDAVETCTTRQLVETDRQHHLQLLGDFLEVLDGDVVFNRRGQLQVIRVRLLAEVRRLEQFLNQDDLRAFGGGFTDQSFSNFDVAFQVPGTGHLSGGDGNDTAHGSSPGKCIDGRAWLFTPWQWRLYIR